MGLMQTVVGNGKKGTGPKVKDRMFCCHPGGSRRLDCGSGYVNDFKGTKG
jgi:hypothetical protein